MTLPLAHPQIVIAGGGVAAIEALLALRHVVGEQVSSRCSRRSGASSTAPRRSVSRSASAARAPSTSLRSPATRAPSSAAGARGRGSGAGSSGSATAGELSYDVLIVAVGAVPKPALPGAVTFAGPAQAVEVAAVLDRSSAARSRRLVFAVPGEATWSLPVYELAIMAAVDLRDRGVANATLGIVTPEPEPLRLFGAAAGAALRAMLDARGITL